MAYDNICKYLTEQNPSAFVRWLLSKTATNIQVLKTELSSEPIRADSLILLQIDNQILHLEFQTLPASEPPIPFRMLKYWVRLYDRYECPIEQVVIFLKQTSSELAFQNEFEALNTRHRFRIVRLWEQEPTMLLENPTLLPLACLARSDSPNALLEQVAARVEAIEELEQRRNLSACVEVLAGLRFDEAFIGQLFSEEIMQESVIYQKILRQGLQQGQKQEAFSMIARLLARRFGAIDLNLQERLQGLSTVQLEELGEALLDFQQPTDLVAWLDELGE